MRIYIHIPFCRQKCLYCKFALTPHVREVAVAKYLRFLKEEIREFFQSRKEKELIDSIYFWWGTPSVLSIDQIEQILWSIRMVASLAENVEISFEANPEDITLSYAQGLVRAGINRISLGVQTLNEISLARIGRGGSKKDIFLALEALFAAKIPSVNVDFILGLPEVRSGEILANITELHTHFPLTHTSVYFLEKGKYPADWQKNALGDEAQCQEYEQIRNYLMTKRGFIQYEISNFALPWHESAHNSGYWKRENCRGFGLSAASLADGVRRENSTSFEGYYRAEFETEILSKESVRIEEILCGLRTFSASRALFENTVVLEDFIAKGLLAEKDQKIFPTSTWIFILDRIIGELI